MPGGTLGEGAASGRGPDQGHVGEVDYHARCPCWRDVRVLSRLLDAALDPPRVQPHTQSRVITGARLLGPSSAVIIVITLCNKQPSQACLPEHCTGQHLMNWEDLEYFTLEHLICNVMTSHL